MFLSQYNQLQKIKISTIVDIDIGKAKLNCRNSGLSQKTIDSINFTNSLDNALKQNIDIFIEATGDPISGTEHAIKIINNKKNIIMVNVEADVLCGKYLSDIAKKNDVIYSMAYGDQPALIVEQIEWAKLNGFLVVGAGKGTKYHSSFEYSTPDTVWKNYGMTDKQAKKAGMNPKMFNSFTTGDKSSIEMAAVANASGLRCPNNGLTYPAVGVYDIANKLIPKSAGGVLDNEGQVEVI
jgi:homoserine dehydrogenase